MGRRLEQVDLAGPEVDPGPGEAEVGPVDAHGASEDLRVERHRRVDVGHIDGDVVDGERVHAPSLPVSVTGGATAGPSTVPAGRRR